MEKIQFYIPNLLDSIDQHSKLGLDEVKVVGVKGSNIKYFKEYPKKQITCIDQIVAEDFALYDIKLDFHAKTISFYLKCETEYTQSEILQKVFQTFAVRYSSNKIGFFLYAEGKNRPNYVRK
ncbi:hypothetical protein MHH81_03435 [Psychrobacillus sp. FSL H8-0484]|uniref:hypothetical protein n=1 Tax=Psychrobacillus sp. FSL H8-0484 TaxID=2921390 RepID=UPI0030FA178C